MEAARLARQRHACRPAPSLGIRLAVFLLAALACCGLVPAPAWAVDDAIVFPSVKESTIAPERDFYVIGTAENAAARGVRVELVRDEGTPSQQTVRLLTFDNANATNPTYLSTARAESFPAIDTYVNTPGIAEAALLMPDLAYDTQTAGSGNLAANKIAANGKNFAALILGGRSSSLGIAAPDTLAAGTYTVRVTLGISTPDTSDDAVLSRPLALAHTADKTMARFSPGSHYAAMEAYAAANGWRVYLDPFPGYWSPQNLGCIYYDDALYTQGDLFLETYRRWRLADGMEYETGTVHCYLYNISPWCATQSVEMGVMQKTNRVDTDLACLYYTLGEPSLTVRDQEISLSNMYTALPTGDKLAYTRAHVAADVGEENRFATYLSHDVSLDTNFADGITVKAGEEVALFGVAAPIQNDPDTEVSFDAGNGSYAIARSISSVAYSFAKDGQMAYEETKPVGLSRDFAASWTNQQSLYEFKHDFATAASTAGALSGDDGDTGTAGAASAREAAETTEASALEAAAATTLGAGTYTVTATALDSNGAPVAGGVETFTLNVQASVNPSPTPQPTPGPTPAASGTPLASTGDATGIPATLAVTLAAASLAILRATRRHWMHRKCSVLAKNACFLKIHFRKMDIILYFGV